ncbi:hypothetical protein [Streptomyces nojiriensis]|uniref:DUF2550 family protein n=1 Tax=Streptomyces nojiriensis TaxID=66374 RepID=A0ABQ3SU80_9ACTN|nr:hypothetical protein [Streptomyces nojiriensis]QTI45238.1 hypothetical protein JYK04_03021 [Streptomyces nojiriensis]GGS36301.1 hypothetical protein GCM10010205_77880 [Streptomyces nojiriensis]GHI71696.1 hypothetical protein Snoj_56140 [Streptomyces nojiriensis]
MIEIVGVVLGAVVAGWLLRRKHRARTAAGPVAGIPCMARIPAGEGRWRMGRVYGDQGTARWVPRRGEPVALPGGRATGIRVPSVKEGISINPGSRIVSCAYDGGGSIEIAVMPLDVRELLEAVPQAGS